MSPSLGLQQTLKQQLTLSPQLIQTFEILAMSSLELQQKIKTEIEQNPALEIPSERSVSLERISEQQARSRPEDDYSDNTPYRSESNQFSTHYSSNYDQEAADRNQQFLEGALARSETLQEYLLRQLGCLRLSEEAAELGRIIISNLDHNGFHRNPVESLVDPSRQPKLLDVLKIVQGLDPSGIAAQDFRESLVIQAQSDNLSDEDMHYFIPLIYEHLEQLRLHKFKEVAKSLKTDEEHIETLYRYLQTLNPYPGLQYSAEETQYIIPDLIVRKRDGKLQLQLNTEHLPTLSIDPDFSALSSTSKEHHDKEAASYINSAIKQASQLINQVQMRSDTMKKIGIELLRFQFEFFLNGPQHLKPLTYRHIAEKLSLHETTISRAVQGKYIDTDWGIIPIKKLFSSALSTTNSTAGTQEVSKGAVMDMVREIVEQHTGTKSLSDQKIADILAQRGIQIARRTVNKYRKELHIDSSYERIT